MEGRDLCESTPVYVRSFLLVIVLKCGVATEKMKTCENQRFRKACCGGCATTVVVVGHACYMYYVIVHTLASMFLLGRHPILVRACADWLRESCHHFNIVCIFVAAMAGAPLSCYYFVACMYV